jgi:hypothetical protein
MEVMPLNQYQTPQKAIHLLSESPVSSERKVVESGVDGAQSACMFLGSFQSSGDAEVLRERLAGLDIESSIQEIEAVSGVDYWVYLPPLASRGASLRQLKELQARQIDSFIIAEVELTNGISLGIFPRYDSALSVMTRLKEAGYEPALKELPRDQRSFWVRVDPQRVRLLDDQLLEGLANSFNELRHEVRPCESIAQAQKFE